MKNMSRYNGNRVQPKEIICKTIGNMLSNMTDGPSGCPFVVVYEPQMPYELIKLELQREDE